MNEWSERLVWLGRGAGGRCRWSWETEICLRVFVLHRRLEVVGYIGEVRGCRFDMSQRGESELLSSSVHKLCWPSGVLGWYGDWFVVVGGWKSRW